MPRHVEELARSSGARTGQPVARTISLIEAGIRCTELAGDEPPFPDVRGFAKVDPTGAAQ
jgi:hypothetical protein